MSNFIRGRIFLDNSVSIFDAKIDRQMVRYCLDKEIGVHFCGMQATKQKNEVKLIFQLSDNFLIHYCEQFLAPILYTKDGVPKLMSIVSDLEKLQGLIEKIYEFSNVKRVELDFAYVEVDDCEYDVLHTNLNEMKKEILQKYLNDMQMPVARIIIHPK